ncbi:hypothetical protein TNCV_908951 [Trichonephila clavipes]|nr:hypothetical protein TNCV_908951 [Trichonephila clavipes]
MLPRPVVIYPSTLETKTNTSGRRNSSTHHQEYDFTDDIERVDCYFLDTVYDHCSPIPGNITDKKHRPKHQKSSPR